MPIPTTRSMPNNAMPGILVNAEGALEAGAVWAGTGTVVRTVAGAVVGTVVGTFTGPVVDTVVGTYVGDAVETLIW